MAALVINFLTQAQHIEFAIVAPTYNNMSPDPKTGRPLCIEHLESIVQQRYPKELVKVYCIDDCSTDGTADALQAYVHEHNLHDYITVIRNTVRKKALHNLWNKIHELQDNIVVITLDGDDQFAHQDVLARVAQEYQDDSVWLTYGQFKHYPSGRAGLCSVVPGKVVEKNRFRNYRWVASHLRSFKAALFKRIPLDDLLYGNDQLYPVTWDQAFMFPLLEMASENHFRYIPDVLYLYKETAQNDYKINYSLPADIEREIRSKPIYKPLQSLPVTSQEKTVDLIVFSKDRPLQLYAHLESVYTYIKNIGSIQVIYHAANNDYANGYASLKKDFPMVTFMQQNMKNPRSDFKKLVVAAVERCSSGYVMFSVDDIIVKDFCDLQECTKALVRTKAYGFYLRLGMHVTECYSENRYQGNPTLIHLYNDIYAWKFITGSGDWGYPNSVDMTIFRTDRVRKVVKKLQYHSPNTFEGQWALHGQKNKLGLCFACSRIINVPLNIVQNDFKNRAMSFSAHDLHMQFKNGKKIDIAPLYNIKNSSAHMEYSPTFIERE